MTLLTYFRRALPLCPVPEQRSAARRFDANALTFAQPSACFPCQLFPRAITANEKGPSRLALGSAAQPIGPTLAAAGKPGGIGVRVEFDFADDFPAPPTDMFLGTRSDTP